MKMRQHYLALRKIYPHVQEREKLEVTTQELSEALDCTHRNMVLLLQRMQREQWLSWEPKRGRGNRSELQFLMPPDELILAEAREVAERHDLQRAVSYVQTMDNGAGALRTQFQAWLAGRFGFQSEVRGERRLDLLRFPLPQRIHSLDPADIHYSGESHLVNQLFDGLVRMSPEGDELLPHLAHAWEVDDARIRWTFYLRKGVLFHHGREMTARDVKFSFERLQALAPKGLYNWVYADMAAIEVVDEQTVTFLLHRPNELLVSFLATNRASVVPEFQAHERSDAAFGAQPVGTGPFRLSGSSQGVYTLEAFSTYFQGRGFLDIVEVWTEPENKSKEDDGSLPDFQVMHNVRLTGQAMEEMQQVKQSGMTCKFMTINELRDGPLRNSAVREALLLALNREALIERLSGDVIEAADSFWPERNAMTDVETAEISGLTASQPPASLMNGYNGEPIVLATIPQYERDAVIVRDLCAEAGFQLTIELIPAEHFKGEARLSADLLLFAIMLDEHRELRLIDLFKSMQHHFLPDVRAHMERKISSLSAIPDRLRRKELLVELETELKQSRRLLFLYRKHLKTAFHPSIRGIALESLGWVRFRDLWFKRV
ncbi:ABC transporter substrate-binding protein [Paenibacillus sp. R14(2021)]|uniref:ABC transporter substrate-binding protein n=1 Tax=Paenibacillus sp. R14(2021) TaxID=2859228 RepID=UPI001C6148DC|nr:ABC transporter substrate-binding protein [Paenibacillus sp. R14(2021)]